MPSRAGNTSQKYCSRLSLCACTTNLQTQCIPASMSQAMSLVDWTSIFRSLKILLGLKPSHWCRSVTHMLSLRPLSCHPQSANSHVRDHCEASHLLMGVNDQSRSAEDVGGSPVAQLPTMSTTESGFAPRRAWAAMGLKLPIASTRTLACTATSACVTQSCTLISM